MATEKKTKKKAGGGVKKAKAAAPMSTAELRFQEVEQTWFDVDFNYDRDMAATRTTPQARAVDENWADTYAAYVRAIADGLEGNGPKIESAFSALKRANKSVKKARADSEKFTAILKKLQKATKAAMKLVLLAS